MVHIHSGLSLHTIYLTGLSAKCNSKAKKDCVDSIVMDENDILAPLERDSSLLRRVNFGGCDHLEEPNGCNSFVMKLCWRDMKPFR